MRFFLIAAAGACVCAFGTVWAAQAPANEDTAMKTIVDFEAGTPPWRNVDDVVMGGVSSSRMRMDEAAAIFEGELSLENQGGFASVRSEPLASGLGGFEGIRLRVKGDGKRYEFHIHTSDGFDGAGYHLAFETERAAWTEVDLPFESFTATYRGRELPDYPPIDAEKIRVLGFLIADKQAGPFRLEIDWIKGYRGGEEHE